MNYCTVRTARFSKRVIKRIEKARIGCVGLFYTIRHVFLRSTVTPAGHPTRSLCRSVVHAYRRLCSAASHAVRSASVSAAKMWTFPAAPVDCCFMLTAKRKSPGCLLKRRGGFFTV